MSRLEASLESKLTELAHALVDQAAARIIVPAQKQSSGFWFGGGNMVEDRAGWLWVVGRYRNYGDSRTGVGVGERGLELAIFRSDDRGKTWQKKLSFSKSDLDVGDRNVVSIEGSALHITDSGVELFVSTEKANIPYPSPFENHLKPGAGVWTIEQLAATSMEGLKDAPIATILESRDPQYVHVKDPFVYERGGDLVLGFCSHPYSWSSSNTAYAIRKRGAGEFGPAVYDFFPRGATWDVAMTRGTCFFDVPKFGAFADADVMLLFYDGGECLRNHEQHATAVKRPRGYSCEEISGAAYIINGDLSRVHRLSRYQPFFISPHGTGCSRYVDVLPCSDGYFVTWQQSQDDLSQPLVMNVVDLKTVESILR